MYKYYYTREIVNDFWNINNPERATTLANDVESLFPNYKFKVFCGDSVVVIVFDNYELTALEKESLDTCVLNHKNNV